MSKTKISTIAELINNVDLVVDVGSDHAHLSKILIKENKSNKVINIEYRDGPLENSIKSTASLMHLHRIENIKSDGLECINRKLHINICVIAGMGAKKIIHILNNAKEHNINNFIIQPNNNTDMIRNWCKKNWWRIKEEHLLKENNIIYEILLLSRHKGYFPISFNSIYFGKMNIKNKDELFIEKWKDELVILQANNFNNKYDKIIKKIKKVINYES